MKVSYVNKILSQEISIRLANVEYGIEKLTVLLVCSPFAIVTVILSAFWWIRRLHGIENFHVTVGSISLLHWTLREQTLLFSFVSRVWSWWRHFEVWPKMVLLMRKTLLLNAIELEVNLCTLAICYVVVGDAHFLDENGMIDCWLLAYSFFESSHVWRAMLNRSKHMLCCFVNHGSFFLDGWGETLHGTSLATKKSWDTSIRPQP